MLVSSLYQAVMLCYCQIDYNQYFSYVFCIQKFLPPPPFFAFPISMSPEPNLYFLPKRQKISCGFSLMLPILQHLHLCLTTCQLPIWILIFKTQAQNLSTSNAEWGSGATAAKPRRGSKKRKRQRPTQG